MVTNMACGKCRSLCCNFGRLSRRSSGDTRAALNCKAVQFLTLAPFLQLTGNEKTLYVTMAKHTCTTGPDLYLTYDAGELFSVLFTASSDKREVPEDSLLVKREKDGTSKQRT